MGTNKAVKAELTPAQRYFYDLTYSHTLKGGDSYKSLPNRESNCGINTDSVKQQRLTSATPKDNALPFCPPRDNC